VFHISLCLVNKVKWICSSFYTNLVEKRHFVYISKWTPIEHKQGEENVNIARSFLWTCRE